MSRLALLSQRLSSPSGAVTDQWTARALVVLSCLLLGCGPAVKTHSLLLEEPPLVQESSAEKDPMPQHFPSPAPLVVTPPSPIRFDPLTSDAPFVYRVIEPTAAKYPLFALTLQSCGKVTRQTALGNARILFTGMGKVQLTPDRAFTIGSERFPLEAADAQFEGEPVFLRVLSVPSPDCLTDFVVWSASDVHLTERAFPVIEQLLLLHRHHVQSPSTGDDTPKT